MTATDSGTGSLSAMVPKPGSRLARASSVADLRMLARRRLPAFSFEYVDGVAEDGRTAARNRAALDSIHVLPRQLAGIERPDVSTMLLGRPAAMPMAVAPTGYNGLLWRDGDLALAGAAARAGIPFIQSTMSSSSIEEVAAVSGGMRHWFQLYPLRDAAMTDSLVKRAQAAGCEALVLTADVAAFGNRESDRRHYISGQTLSLRSRLQALTRPGWIANVLLAKGPPRFGNLTEFLPAGKAGPFGGAHFIAEQLDPAFSWDLLARLRAAWPGKLIVKGLLRDSDAVEAARCGADAIVLSNHGGRQLDGAVSPMDVLPQIRHKLPGECEVLVDSGFRRGTDIFKAIALGADAVVCGRAGLFGLAAGGEAGAARAFDILRSELMRTLHLAGCNTLAAARDDAVVRFAASGGTP